MNYAKGEEAIKAAGAGRCLRDWVFAVASACQLFFLADYQ
jgi:hypothetical protein